MPSVPPNSFKMPGFAIFNKVPENYSLSGNPAIVRKEVFICLGYVYT